MQRFPVLLRVGAGCVETSSLLMLCNVVCLEIRMYCHVYYNACVIVDVTDKPSVVVHVHIQYV